MNALLMMITQDANSKVDNNMLRDLQYMKFIIDFFTDLYVRDMKFVRLSHI